MSAWNWFTRRGDDVLTFAGLAAVSLQQSGLLDPLAAKWAAEASLLAAIAHKVFFPNPPSPVAQ